MRFLVGSRGTNAIFDRSGFEQLLGTIAARRCLSQTVPTAGDPWSPEQANNEPTQQNAGHARIFGFPIEPVGSLTICTAYGTPDDSVAPQPLVRQKPIVSHLHPELFVR